MRTPAALLLLSTAVFAQSDCAVSGVVLHSVTHAAIPRVRVSLDGQAADTDQEGKWSIAHVACGKVTMTATRPGFLRLERRIVTPATDLRIDLIPQAVVTGRVMDELGDPIIGSHVSLVDIRIIDGERGVQLRSSADTNDLGEFRFSGLPKGRYILCANVSSGGVTEGARRYGDRCSPAPLDSGMAGAAEIAAGEERRIDFVLPLLPTVRVSGVVLGLPERTHITAGMAPQTQMPGAPIGFSTQVKADGTFLFRNVPAGSYKLTAFTDTSGASIPVTVGSVDLTDLRLRIDPPVTVAVRINVESVAGKTIEKLDGIVRLWGPQNYSGRAAANNEIVMDDVTPGAYHLEYSPPLPFYVKGVVLDGRNIRGQTLAVQRGLGKLEVALSDDGGAIEGDVSVDDHPEEAWVLLEKDGTPIQNSQADAKGHFRVTNLPPGDYKVYAWDDGTKVEYRNPEWMQRYGKPVSVTIAPTQSAQVKLIRQIAPN